MVTTGVDLYYAFEATDASLDVQYHAREPRYLDNNFVFDSGFPINEFKGKSLASDQLQNPLPNTQIQPVPSEAAAFYGLSDVFVINVGDSKNPQYNFFVREDDHFVAADAETVKNNLPEHVPKDLETALIL